MLIVVLAIAVRDQLPHRRASSFAVMLLGLFGVALIPAAFMVDTAMLRGGNPDTWHGWIHGIAFLLIIAVGVLAPLTLASSAGRPRLVANRVVPSRSCALRRLPALASGQLRILIAIALSVPLDRSA